MFRTPAWSRRSCTCRVQNILGSMEQASLTPIPSRSEILNSLSSKCLRGAEDSTGGRCSTSVGPSTSGAEDRVQTAWALCGIAPWSFPGEGRPRRSNMLAAGLPAGKLFPVCCQCLTAQYPTAAAARMAASTATMATMLMCCPPSAELSWAQASEMLAVPSESETVMVPPETGCPL